MENLCTILDWGQPHISAVHLYKTLPSTNSLAKSLIAAGAAHGTVIWALEQTAGRGRRGRTWFADNNTLTLSVIWQLPDYTKAGQLPLALGLAIARELQGYSPNIMVKWPNDLWAQGRKLGGILCESLRHAGQLWMVAGVGINVNRSPAAVDFPWVSLEECCGFRLLRFEVLLRVLAGASTAFPRVLAGEVDFTGEFRRYGNFLNQPIFVIADGEAVPLGGMGLCRQAKDEVANCPPFLLLVERVADAWLATWSRADAVVPYPIDPIRLPASVADVLRARLGEQARVS